MGLILIAVLPALWIRSYCSSPEQSEQAVPNRITIQSEQRETYGTNPEQPPITQFSFGSALVAPKTTITRTDGTYYATPEPYKWGRRFVCDVNGADYTLALFTVILALSTIFLWRETERLAEGAERQAEDTRALFFAERRPWINATIEPDSDLRFNIEGADITFRFVATNSGESPGTFVIGRVVAMPHGVKTNDAINQFVKENRTFSSLEMGVTVFPERAEELLAFNLRIGREDFELVGFSKIGYAPSLMCAVIYKTPLDDAVHQTAFLAELRTKGMLHVDGPPVLKEHLSVRTRGLWSHTD